VKNNTHDIKIVQRYNVDKLILNVGRHGVDSHLHRLHILVSVSVSCFSFRYKKYHCRHVQQRVAYNYKYKGRHECTGTIVMGKPQIQSHSRISNHLA